LIFFNFRGYAANGRVKRETEEQTLERETGEMKEAIMRTSEFTRQNMDEIAKLHRDIQKIKLENEEDIHKYGGQDAAKMAILMANRSELKVERVLKECNQ
jgi:hypothetical protein